MQALKDFFLQKKNLYRILFLILIVLIYLCVRWFFDYYAYSRDGYLFANVVSVNSRVPGQVEKINTYDNQKVKKGQLLFALDPQKYQYAVNQAKAQLHLAEINYQRLENAEKGAVDALKQEQTLLALAKDHLQRYAKLSTSGDISQITVADTEAKVQRLQASVAQAQQKLDDTRKRLNQNTIKAARATLNTAEYNLTHTKIYAPADGRITNFFMRVGNYVQAGETLFALVETDKWWVITRYRETMLSNIKVGDKVSVRVDMFSEKTFEGVVTSIGWGINRKQTSSNAAPSSLAYLKATEYWIRIAQRFPVRIRIVDANMKKYPFRVGASARTTVLLKDHDVQHEKQKNKAPA